MRQISNINKIISRNGKMGSVGKTVQPKTTPTVKYTIP